MIKWRKRRERNVFCLAAHNGGKGAKYTRSRLPVELVWWEECPTKQAAMSREWQVKHLTREEKLKLIRGGPIRG